jgi:hypothetical protein
MGDGGAGDSEDDESLRARARESAALSATNAGWAQALGASALSGRGAFARGSGGARVLASPHTGRTAVTTGRTGKFRLKLLKS